MCISEFGVCEPKQLGWYCGVTGSAVLGNCAEERSQGEPGLYHISDNENQVFVPDTAVEISFYVARFVPKRQRQKFRKIKRL